jgi:2-keto-3-deoxy-L-rhamnonate aldolase RhmA
VRVAEPARPVIQSALDQGAAGVILPQIRDLAHAEVAASFAKFPPRGSRGIGFSRTMSYGGAGDDFIAAENAERLCFLMVETPGALRDAKAIAALDCVDGLFIGPGDLSLTRGRGIFKGTKADRDDLRDVADAAKVSGKLFAAAAPNADYCREAMGLGARFVTVADELSAMRAGFEALKKAVTAGSP